MGDQLFVAGKNCWRTARAERFGWCIDGEEYFRALRLSLGKAEREILIVGWDIDSRFQLIRDETHPEYPSPLCETLQELVDANDELCVRVLSWDFALVYVLERELLPAYKFGWQSSERLHFELDSAHTTGASHHQKIVVVDGAIAFSGGIDLTKCRWDTRRHAAGDDGRRDPDGAHYDPFHDVQGVVTGQAAQALRELVSDRWQNATGEALPEMSQSGSGDRIWPDGVEVRARDADVAIARTWTGVDDDPAIQEIQQLYIDSIRAARSYVYLENQYFTSMAIAEAIATRLQEPDGPEVVLVLPGKTSGWLEQATMDVLRNRAIKHLRDADRHGHLRILTPVSDELGETVINVHAKIMVADNRLTRIGSANLSRRSMGLDSECDLVVIDENAAGMLCADLLAEHMGGDIGAVANALTDGGLFTAIDKLNGGTRRLEPLETDASELEHTLLEPMAKIADLEQPILRSTEAPAETVKGSDDEHDGMHTPVVGWVFLALLLGVISFWVFWAVKGAGGDFDANALLDRMREAAAHPLAPLLALPVFVAGSLVMLPVIAMIAVCGLLFDPWIASLAAMAGTLLATATNHWVGGHFGRAISGRIPKSVQSKIDMVADSADIWSLAGLRLIPIAPFSVINLLVGTAGISLRDFLIGTLIGMGPGIVLICLSVDRALAALAGEPVFDPWIGAAAVAAGVAVIGLRFWRQRQV